MRYFDQAVGMAAIVLTTFLLGCSGAGSGTPTNPTAAVAPYPPPPKRAEIPPVAPSPDLLWLGGNWGWDGAKYRWIAGHYVQRPTPTANWLPGYWDQQSGGWLWTEGHWES
jgi:hypothetical protein